MKGGGLGLLWSHISTLAWMKWENPLYKSLRQVMVRAQSDIWTERIHRIQVRYFIICTSSFSILLVALYGQCKALNPEIHLNYTYSIDCHITVNTHAFSTKTSWFKMSGDKTAVYCNNHTKHINKSCGQNVTSGRWSYRVLEFFLGGKGVSEWF